MCASSIAIFLSYLRWPSSAAQRSLYCILNTTRLRQSRKRTSKFSAFSHLQGEVRDKRVRTYKQKEESTITGKLQTHTFSHFFNDTHLHPNTIVIKDSLLETSFNQVENLFVEKIEDRRVKSCWCCH